MSSPCNVVIVSDFFYRAKLNNLPDSQVIDSKANWSSGHYQTVTTSVPGLTLTNLPIPTGRMPNYSQQKQVIDSADVFIFACSTVNFSQRALSRCPVDVPTLCWIDCASEQIELNEWKKNQRARLLKLYKDNSNLQVSKTEKQTKTTRLWITGPNPFPLITVEELKAMIDPSRKISEFFSSSTSSLKLQVREEKNEEWSEEFKKNWEGMLMRAKELHLQNSANAVVLKKRKVSSEESSRKSPRPRAQVEKKWIEKAEVVQSQTLSQKPVGKKRFQFVNQLLGVQS